MARPMQDISDRRRQTIPSPWPKPSSARPAQWLLLLLLMLIVLWRGQAGQARAEALRAEMERSNRRRMASSSSRMADLVRIQSEMTGRMQTMAEVFGSRQSELVRGLSERLDGLGHRIGQSMTETTTQHP